VGGCCRSSQRAQRDRGEQQAVIDLLVEEGGYAAAVVHERVRAVREQARDRREQQRRHDKPPQPVHIPVIGPSRTKLESLVTSGWDAWPPGLCVQKPRSTVLTRVKDVFFPLP
jgi:hypothetical protein